MLIGLPKSMPEAPSDGKLWNLPPRGNRGKRNGDFSTVPTGLGKLSASNAPSFPQFPQLRLRLVIFFKKLLALPLNENCQSCLRRKLSAMSPNKTNQGGSLCLVTYLAVYRTILSG